MPTLVALDVAILLPPDVRGLAIALSGSLPKCESKGLRLDEDHLPHVTLTQQFVRTEDLEVCIARIGDLLAGQSPLGLRVTGGATGSSSVWMGIARSPELVDLHERLMGALGAFERRRGGVAAFHGGDARVGDVRWVSRYRFDSAFGAFTPHITLGHARTPPEIEPATFEADTVAACHLGRFCSCRRILRSWTLRGGPRS